MPKKKIITHAGVFEFNSIAWDDIQVSASRKMLSYDDIDEDEHRALFDEKLLEVLTERGYIKEESREA